MTIHSHTKTTIRSLKFSYVKPAILAVAISLLTVLAFSTAAVRAAPSGGSSLTTSPVAVNLVIKPGTSTTTTLQVMNNNLQPAQIATKVELFSAYGTAGQAAITPPSAANPSANWVTLSPASFTAQPGVWTSIKMTISLPPSASLGYYYAVMFEPQLPFNTPAPNTNTIKGSNAVLVLVDTNSANEKRQLQVTNFSVSQQLYEYLPASFSVTVHNSGNIYLPPQASIYISQNSNFSSTSATLDVNKAAGNVLPNSSRVFQVEWSNGFPVFNPKTVDGQIVYSKGQPVKQLQWDFTKLNRFRFGKYYAKLVLVYNNGSRDIPIVGVVSFWVIPWKLMIILFLVVATFIGLIIGVIYLLHRVRVLKKAAARHHV
jgi:hypothetical protein